MATKRPEETMAKITQQEAEADAQRGICPLLSIHGERLDQCLGPECAWWNDSYQQCYLVTLTQSIGGIENKVLYAL